MSNFVVGDPKKCIGCRTCEIACVDAHSTQNIFLTGMQEIKFEPCLTVIKTATFSVPTQCRQCEDAPCANACPNGSIYEKDNAIFINKETCIGCKTCMLACPFGALKLVEYHDDKGDKQIQAGLQVSNNGSSKLAPKHKMVVQKCDLCVERTNGVGPACVQICPTGSLRVVSDDKLDEDIVNKRLQSALCLANN